jgi:hypothetical protein
MKIKILIAIISLFFIFSCAGKRDVNVPYNTPAIEICRFYIDYKEERNVCVKSYLLFIDKCWVRNK